MSDDGTVVSLGTGDAFAMRSDQRDEDRKWLSTTAIAEIAGVAPQIARRAVTAGHWHDCILRIRHVKSSRGQSGKVPQVHVDTLPRDVREAWYLANGIDLNATPAVATGAVAQGAPIADDPAWQEAVALARWKAKIIAPILTTEPRSAERGAAMAEIIATPLTWANGKRKAATKATLTNWVRAYEANGLQGLMRKKRKDATAQRVSITRAWDTFFDGADPAERDAVADAVQRYMRSLWAGGENGWRAVSEKATTKLITLSAPLGCGFDDLPYGRMTGKASGATQIGVCTLSRRRVEAERGYSAIAVKDRDNAAWEDLHAPRITRDYSDLSPRDMIVGDVHPVDIMMHRPDGTIVYPKAIAWYDAATTEVWMTFVMLEPGEGVRREHVAASFASMVEAWGLPKLLYLDNGSEYSWAEMIDGFTMLSKLAGAMSVFELHSDKRAADRIAASRQSIIRSLAYNAPGKPGIEGVFGNLEQTMFRCIEGWVAGDRMNKKTHRKGHDPVAFPGTMDDFMREADAALEWYHKRPQHGRLEGRSPNEALAGHIDRGWGKTALASPDVLLLAFAYEATRVPDRGRVRYASPRGGASVTYYHDALLPLTGQRVTIKSPAGRNDVLFVFHDEKLICLAKPEQTFHPLDPAGAEEGARRRKALNRVISERRTHCDRLSLSDETARHVAQLPAAPVAPVLQTVNHAEIEEMHRRLRASDVAALDDPAPARPALDQWGARDESAANVTFLEEDDDE